MSSYIGKVALGSLYSNGAIKNRPLKPWMTDTAPYTGCELGDLTPWYADTTITNTSSDDAQKLYWHKIIDGNKILFIADRVLVHKMTWNQLSAKNYVLGKTINIDGKDYKIRLLTGNVAGNEWDRFIVNTDGISNLPTPAATDIDHTLNATDRASAHNQFWNWFGARSYCQESNIPTNVGTTTRGGYDANTNMQGDGTLSYYDLGWRPVLELIDNIPTISGAATENLGNKNVPFNITFSVNDADVDNVLSVITKFNGTQLTSIPSAIRNTEYTVEITKDMLYSVALNQQATIEISVSDGNIITTKTITFSRSNSLPTITNVDKNLGEISRELMAEKYTCNDVDNDAITIVEKIDSKTIRTFNGVASTEYTTNIPKDVWLDLTNGTHTYSVIVTDEIGSSSTRVFTFIKKETSIEVTSLKNLILTETVATKLLITPNWSGIDNATITFEACNNAFDASPTWENIMPDILLGKPHTFTNITKTSDKWGINIRFKLIKKDTATDNVEIYGISGAYSL